MHVHTCVLRFVVKVAGIFIIFNNKDKINWYLSQRIEVGILEFVLVSLGHGGHLPSSNVSNT